MSKRGWATLLVAGVMGSASQAGATVMLATFSGYYDVLDPTGVIGPAGVHYFYDTGSGGPVSKAATTTTVTFDTELGDLKTLPAAGGGTYQVLTWDASMGAPNPVISAGIVIDTQAIQGSPAFPYRVYQHNTFDLGTLHAFSITRSSESGLSLSVTATGGVLFFTESYAPKAEDARLDQPFSLPLGGPTLWGSGSIGLPGFADYSGNAAFPTGVTAPFYAATLAVVGPSPGVPEPATWLMLVAGFFGLGGYLRAVRRASRLGQLLSPP